MACDRNMLVCFRRGCRACPWDARAIPEDCPYAICHAVEVERLGDTIEGGRRSGKTTRLLAMASRLSAEGFPVYVLCRNDDSARTMQAAWRGAASCRFMSAMWAGTRMRGLRPGFVMFDEVGADGVGEVMRFAEPGGHVFACAVRSSE